MLIKGETSKKGRGKKGERNKERGEGGNRCPFMF